MGRSEAYVGQVRTGPTDNASCLVLQFSKYQEQAPSPVLHLLLAPVAGPDRRYSHPLRWKAAKVSRIYDTMNSISMINFQSLITLDFSSFRRMLKVYKKIHKFMEVLNYFTTKEWLFTNDHVNSLLAKLDNKDRSLFFCDMREVVWDTYFQNYMRGIRLYLIKDPIETLPQALVKWQRLVTDVALLSLPIPDLYFTHLSLL